MPANDAKRICWRDLHVSYKMHVPTLFVSTAHTAFSYGRQGTDITASRTALPYLRSASNSFYKKRSGFSKVSFDSLYDSCCVFRYDTYHCHHTWTMAASPFSSTHKNRSVSAHCFPQTLQYTGSSQVLFVSVTPQCPYTGEDDKALCL
jgi:hypothetical protein